MEPLNVPESASAPGMRVSAPSTTAGATSLRSFIVPPLSRVSRAEPAQCRPRPISPDAGGFWVLLPNLAPLDRHRPGACVVALVRLRDEVPRVGGDRDRVLSVLAVS